MNPLLAFYRSSIGRKWVVAITGLVLFGFVLGHMIGNLQMFWGPDQINSYAVHLRDLGPLLWIVRIVLIVCFVLHVQATIALARANRAARPEKYAFYNTKTASKASRTMVISGLIVLSFLIFHLLHFTFGWIDAKNAHFVQQLQDPRLGPDRHDVYRMVVAGFNHWSVSFFYLVGIGLLCLHLSHGFSSVFQTLGLRNHRVEGALRWTSGALCALLFIGYCAIPLAVMVGALTDTNHPFGQPESPAPKTALSH